MSYVKKGEKEGGKERIMSPADNTVVGTISYNVNTYTYALVIDSLILL